MKKMRFFPELAAFLKEHKYIYTVRRYRYSLLDNLIYIDDVGVCERVHIQQIRGKENLEEYVSRSGFETIEDWWKKIKTINKGYVGLYYLYEITTKEME